MADNSPSEETDSIDTQESVAQILSHDLSNLLVTAQSSLELAQRNHEDEHLERTATILDNAEALVDDIVTLTRTGNQVDDVVSTELVAVAERAWPSVANSTAALQIDESRTILADASSLRLLLENLFRNAVEHGRTDATVTVGIVQRTNRTGFYVADNGEGLPMAEPDRVFTPGYSTTKEGMGIGLAIVQRIADAHGWTITVMESDTGGARFEFTNVDIVE
jgi:signal transduction histidine kinase